MNACLYYICVYKGGASISHMLHKQADMVKEGQDNALLFAKIYDKNTKVCIFYTYIYLKIDMSTKPKYHSI